MFASVGHKALTASGSVKASSGALVAVNICGAADAATVTIYDNTEGSGTVVAKLGVAANLSDSFCPAHPIVCAKGIYATITGTTPNVQVAFI